MSRHFPVSVETAVTAPLWLARRQRCQEPSTDTLTSVPYFAFTSLAATFMLFSAIIAVASCWCFRMA